MTAGFNFLEQPELPAPQVSETQAEHLLSVHYGLTARAESLGSQQDKNFLVFDLEDRLLGVLKIANPAFTVTELAAQDAAAELISEAEPTLRVAVPLPNLTGEKCTTVTDLLDGTAHVRLLRYLPGGTLVGAGHLSSEVVAGMGELAARVSRALAGFRHPGLDRALQWDLRHGHGRRHRPRLARRRPVRAGPFDRCRPPPRRRGSRRWPTTSRARPRTST